MTRRKKRLPDAPRASARKRLPARTRHTTVTTPQMPELRNARAGKRRVARIVEDEDASLLDLLDNLLTKGVMLNADLILALADVDLVYVRLSALLCAADRVLPRLALTRRTGAKDPSV